MVDRIPSPPSPRLVFLDLRLTPYKPMAAPAESVLCLGNFDGVHLAHENVLREGVRVSRTLSDTCLCGAFCFFRPSSDFKPGDAPMTATHLTTLKEKLHLFRQAGVDFACLCDFNDLRHLSPEAFCELLIVRSGCRGVVCGFNYRFGAGGRGRPEHLRAAFDRPDMAGATILPEMTLDGVTVSSSHIRRALLAGDIESAARLLGRPYALQTRVVTGKHLGHTLGFPTANQYFPSEILIPAHGVYAARAHTRHGVFPAVANIGVRPTVDGSIRPRVNCETHLIGFHGDLYGSDVRVELLQFLRPEQRFDTLDALRAAIADDVEKVGRLTDAGRL